MAKTLEDIKVLSNTVGFNGPYCGQLLADLGATVIRITGRPGGGDDYLKRYFEWDPVSAPCYFNRNKSVLSF